MLTTDPAAQAQPEAEPCRVPGCYYPDIGLHDCPGAAEEFPVGSHVRVFRTAPANTWLDLCAAHQAFLAHALAYRNFGEPDIRDQADQALADLARYWATLVETRDGGRDGRRRGDAGPVPG